jgi:UDP-N-acetylmuramate: L-alanyl-gamma-D-glutamyl-meso-diaminopimelate ligase
MGPALEQWGVRTMQGFDPKNLEARPDLVVVGNVCRRDNPEVVRARELGLETTHIAGALQRFAFPGTSPLVVAGTHGKTTTSSLAAYLLDRVGFAPGFLIGGLPHDLPRSFRAAERRDPRRLPAADGRRRNTPFVIEGDEYDTAYFEKTAKFLHYSAEVAIITSIEYDHVDIYPNFESYLAAFERFVRELPKQGLVVAHAGDPNVVEVVTANARCEVSYYALSDEDTRGVAPHWLGAIAGSDSSGTSFDLFAGGVSCGRLATRLSGRHNVANAIAALAASAQGFGAKIPALRSALSEFSGVKRRQELLGTPGGVFVYDDFAHHPTAVNTTLRGLRRRHDTGKLLAVFEPRSATACRNLHQAEYVTAFEAADRVLLAPLGRSGLGDDERLDTGKLARELSERGKVASVFDAIDAIVEAIERHAEPGDIVAVLSNGTFGGIHERLLRVLERERPTGGR